MTKDAEMSRSIKINISGVSIRQLLEDHPDIIAEITENATKQVADGLSSKFNRQQVEKYATMVEKRIDERLASKYSFPPPVMKLLTDVSREIVVTHAQQIAHNIAKETVQHALVQVHAYLRQRIDAELRQVVVSIVDELLAKRIAAYLATQQK
jgi:TRAP-type mannitol/chloroaromatic compound transport system substrate-binding protein